MKPSDNLYLLIKSLTGNEKRYFKVFAKRHISSRQSKYEQLFDVYDSLGDDEYDESELKKKLQKKSLGKNLADDKKNLQEMIMRSMLSFHSGTSVDSQLGDLLAEEDFYRQKRLNALRQKTITRAKELAEKYEKYPQLSIILDREYRMNVELQPQQLKDMADTVGEAKQILLDLTVRMEQMSAVRKWLFLQVRMNMKKDHPAYRDKLDAVMRRPPVSDYVPGQSFTIDMDYHRVHIYYARMTTDIGAERRHSEMLLDLFHVGYPHMQQERRLDYHLTVFNYLTTLAQASDWARYEELLEISRSFKAQNEDEEGEHFQNIIFYEQLLYMNTGQVAKACAMAAPIREGIAKYSRKINKARQITMYLNLALSFFLREQWTDALTYLNDITGDQSDARRDMKLTAKMLSFICMYELREYEHLSYTLRNVTRSKEYEDLQADPYRPLISMLSKMIKEPHQARDIIASHTAACRAAYEIELWAQSILTGRRMEDLFTDYIKAPTA